jgi:calcium-dependent protein kinase
MDFGLSSVEEFTDPVVGLFGSIDYVSPEALSQGKITTKSDMWSLGVILYILLSGYVFFSSLSYVGILLGFMILIPIRKISLF